MINCNNRGYCILFSGITRSRKDSCDEGKCVPKKSAWTLNIVKVSGLTGIRHAKIGSSCWCRFSKQAQLQQHLREVTKRLAAIETT